ncbi:DUF3592 domain-containing protein [Clostridium porci]|uniref:DUF3592 domain-containing protein n=1 Tax=Clostridium porci TaxID=2605778 RepID=A0A7X2NKN2_9CLOT|nr:DUF3592 domain-containing protein [Clostridium porci]MSS36582.1 DUF3592 domain-containing protein [Clostridium porci]
MSENDVFTWICLGFLFLGMVFFCIGLALLRSAAHKDKVCTLPVNATIVDWIEDTTYHIDRGHSTRWHPVYEYTVNGRMIRRRSTLGYSRPQRAIGTTVTLMVNPAKAEEHHCPDGYMRFLGRVFLMIGVAIICAGIAVGLARIL